MPNLLWNPHSFNVRGLCTVIIVTIHSETITIPFASKPELGSCILLRQLGSQSNIFCLPVRSKF